MPVKFEYPPPARIEWLIAGARVVLAVGGLLAAVIAPPEPSALEPLAYWLMSLYVVYSVAVLALASNPVNFARGWGLTGHIVDLATFAIFMFLADVSGTPFFMYFVFAVTCGALRWESRGAILTWAVVIALYGAVSLAATASGSASLQLSRFVVRGIQLTVVGMLITYLSSYHPHNLQELLRIASWPNRLPQDERAVVAEVLEQAHDILPAPRLLMVWEVPDEDVVNLAWRGDTGVQWAREPKQALSPLVIGPLEHASFHARDVARADARVDFWSPRGFLRMQRAPINEALRARFNMQAVQSSRIDGEILQGRLFWLDKRRMRLDDLLVGELVGRLSASRLDGAYLLAHFREAAALDERVRMARDLHDSLLQALAGTGLQLAVARRLLDREPETARRGLDDVQMHLEQHEMELRSLISRLRPMSGDERIPSLGALGQRLDEFRRRVESQWQVKVVMHLPPLIASLADDLSAQLSLIVQEAVLNAARHANATTIRAVIESDERGVFIRVSDDGKGFPFVGSYDLATLNMLQSGPLTLKERVAELGGDLRINSGPSGAEVRITVPFAHALS